ncbi:MAG: hypothetical protein ACRDHZ_03635 [Ktedonobacteraceae bacterium]
MIDEREQERIRLLSDTAFYPQAVEFMQKIGGVLPSSQINGLLNVTHANTYRELEDFIKHQYTRSTWGFKDQHIPDFYRKLESKLREFERLVTTVTKDRQEKPAHEEQQTIKMLLAREFIQHVLAENAYKDVQIKLQKQPERTTYQSSEARPHGSVNR